MKKLFTILGILFISLFYTQAKLDFGDKIQFFIGQELDVKLVMLDDSFTYMQSTLNEPVDKRFVIRKFDSNNKYINTFTQNYPDSNDSSLYHNYLGSFSTQNKVAFISNEYSGKSKKNTIYITVFDKSTEKFETTQIASFDIESAMKSGDLDFALSDNGRFAGVIFYAKAAKKELQKSTVFIIDTNSQKISWSREIELSDVTRYFAISNSGKAIITRDPNSYKGSTKIIYLSKEDLKETLMEGDMLLYQPYVFSMGNKDILFAFDSESRYDRDSYQNILIYDLEQDKMVSNVKTKYYETLKKPEKVEIDKIYFQNGQYQLLTKAKVFDSEVKDSQGFTEKKYYYKNANIISISEAGELISGTSLGTNEGYRPKQVLEKSQHYGISFNMGKYYELYFSILAINEINPSGLQKKKMIIDNETNVYN